MNGVGCRQWFSRIQWSSSQVAEIQRAFMMRYAIIWPFDGLVAIVRGVGEVLDIRAALWTGEGYTQAQSSVQYAKTTFR